MDFAGIAILSVLGFITGMYSTLVGGGALLMTPAMIFLGMGPHEAIATNKFTTIGANIAGWSEFHRKKLIDYRVGGFIGIFALLGAISGTFLLLDTKPEFVKKAVSIATLILLAVTLLKKDAGLVKKKKALTSFEWVACAAISFAIGLYGGFYGGGFATLFSYLLVLFFGQTFLESAGTRKIAGAAIILISTAILAMNNMILYSVGIPVFLTTSAGAYIGAHYSTRIGNVWLKRMFFMAVLLMALEMLI